MNGNSFINSGWWIIDANYCKAPKALVRLCGNVFLGSSLPVLLPVFCSRIAETNDIRKRAERGIAFGDPLTWSF